MNETQTPDQLTIDNFVVIGIANIPTRNDKRLYVQFPDGSICKAQKWQGAGLEVLEPLKSNNASGFLSFALMERLGIKILLQKTRDWAELVGESFQTRISARYSESPIHEIELPLELPIGTVVTVTIINVSNAETD